MPKTGMVFPRQLAYDKWLGIGRRLAAVSTSSAWCLGDWLAYGEDVYSGRYRDAIEQTSLDYQTLRNYAWVARRFPLSRRRDDLSFAHHAEVAGLPDHERDFWLRKAKELSWSRNKLRHEIRSSLAERNTGDESGSKDADIRGDRDDGNDHRAAGDQESGDTMGAGREVAPDRQAVSPGFSRERAEVHIQIRLSADQLASCRAAAGRLGCSIEEWAASTLHSAARQELGG